MPRRAASPAPSETEIDIFGSLYPGEEDGDSYPQGELDVDGILNAPDGDNGDDEAFIALQQAASYRKASNLKGRTVKKGGGFQAMGATAPHYCCVTVTNDNSRPQCQLTQGNHAQGILGTDADSEEDHPVSAR